MAGQYANGCDVSGVEFVTSQLVHDRHKPPPRQTWATGHTVRHELIGHPGVGALVVEAAVSAETETDHLAPTGTKASLEEFPLLALFPAPLLSRDLRPGDAGLGLGTGLWVDKTPTTDLTGTDRRNGPHPPADEGLGPGLETGSTGGDLTPGHGHGRVLYPRTGGSGNEEGRDLFRAPVATLRTKNGIGSGEGRGRKNTGRGVGVETERSERRTRKKTKRSVYRLSHSSSTHPYPQIEEENRRRHLAIWKVRYHQRGRVQYFEFPLDSQLI